MTTRSRITTVIMGAICASALLLSTESVLAAITWAGAWSAEKPAGTEQNCSENWVGEYPGTSQIINPEEGRVLALCWSGSATNCGGSPGWQYHVRARGRDAATNLTELTPGTWGPTVFSTAGGASLEYHQCQKGYEAL